MPTTNITQAETNFPPDAPKPDSGMTNADFHRRLDQIQQKRGDPQYDAFLERLFSDAEAYRRQINEEERRRLDAEEGK